MQCFAGLGFELWQVTVNVCLDQAIKGKQGSDPIGDRISLGMKRVLSLHSLLHEVDRIMFS